jgi:hypothetical protein
VSRSSRNCRTSSRKARSAGDHSKSMVLTVQLVGGQQQDLIKSSIDPNVEFLLAKSVLDRNGSAS